MEFLRNSGLDGIVFIRKFRRLVAVKRGIEFTYDETVLSTCY